MHTHTHTHIHTDTVCHNIICKNSNVEYFTCWLTGIIQNRGEKWKVEETFWLEKKD